MKKTITTFRYLTFVVSLLLIEILHANAQPANNNCTQATEIAVSNGGYGLGKFYSDTSDISLATMQPGETVPPAIFVAGQNQKSIWYKFTLSTNRSVRVTLSQPGAIITAGDVGFSVYKANTCLPGNTNLSTKLTPIERFGNTYHPCVDSGTYLVQISSRQNANGTVFIELDVNPVNTLYDERTAAYDFGLLSRPRSAVTYTPGCHSIENSYELCPAFPTTYNKSTWHTFTTPSYYDYISVLLSSSVYAGFTGGRQMIGYTLYEGDAVNTPFTSLIPVTNCDSFSTEGRYADYKTYECGALKTNTKYSIRLLFHEDFNQEIKLAIYKEGIDSTKAPQPINTAIPSSNTLGQLPYGTTTRTDYFACNGRHKSSTCGTILPQVGVPHNGRNYNISTFFTFSLAAASNVQITSGTQPYSECRDRLIRVFRTGVTGNCADISISDLYEAFTNDKKLICLPAGDYTIQIMGVDSVIPNTGYLYNELVTYPYTACLRSNFGQQINLTIKVDSLRQDNKFDLAATGRTDSLNDLQPIPNNIYYRSAKDTFGCATTLLPGNNGCAATFTKAMYREVSVADSGSLRLSHLSNAYYGTNGNNRMRYQLFKGSATALAAAQSVFSYPDTIAGLSPQTPCFDYNNITWWCDSMDICVTPGDYTLVTFGQPEHTGFTDSPRLKVQTIVTKHYDPATVHNMGNIIDSIGNPNGGSIHSGTDYFSCKDNAVPINGINPCNNATKAIYREFYLSRAAITNIAQTYYSCNAGSLSLFSGQLSSTGFSGLTPVSGWNCFTSKQTAACELLQPGWYTVVSWANGSGYGNPSPGGNVMGDAVGKAQSFTITLSFDCAGPSFNRPHKAAVDPTTNAPFLIEWNAAANTGAYPVTGVTYTLPTEYFNCTVDTPFSTHPISGCNNNFNRVSYYTFRLTQESYLVLYPGTNNWTKLYKLDVRTDSSVFATTSPLQACMNADARIEICKAQPGTYTMVIFASLSDACRSITPKIYVDRVGYSRFDHAINAYDFGTIPADNTYYNGKPGDINPLHSGRAASNDFFYCTTGAQSSDPTEPGCGVVHNPNVYKQPDTNNVLFPTRIHEYHITRRNLWYTFIIDKPGWVHVKVDAKTSDKISQSRFAVYKSDVDGTLPFATVVSNGLVDSTLPLGLNTVANNAIPDYYCGGANVASFFIEPCNFRGPYRYYVLVDNRNPAYFAQNPANNNMRPNHQVEVSIRFDSTTIQGTKYDYFSRAYNMDTIYAGISYFGDEDNFSCATRSTQTDHNAPACATRTIWYKFTVGKNVTGTARIRAWIDSVAVNSNYQVVELYRVKNPNDSSTNGLSRITTSYVTVSGTHWASSCVSEGTYYFLLTGCGQLAQYVYPEVYVEETAGDYCNSPLVATVSGSGNSNVTVNIDCHSIGTDYGEFAPTLSCPANGITNNYKTSWFRIDITGTDTLDVTTYLTENTRVNPADIQYRMMTGNCNAMQEQSCVMDAETQNTYKCMIPGNSYYIQVFSPQFYNNNNPAYSNTGTIRLNLSAVKHTDTCAPMNACMANANFIPEFDCALNDSVLFRNYSTYGNDITYHWDFGYNNQTSTDVSPRFRYPSLATAATYQARLIVINTSCNRADTTTVPVVIPAAPYTDLGNDTALCDVSTGIRLDATVPGSATYRWQDNSTNPTYQVSAPGLYHVQITRDGCTFRDSIKISVATSIVRTVYDTACGGTNYTLPAGTSTTVSGTYYDTLYPPSGCDSVIITNLHFRRQHSGTITDAVCAGDLPYAWNGQNIFSGGTPAATHRTTDRFGCDSITVLNLTVHPAARDTLYENICQEDLPYNFQGSNISNPGWHRRSFATGAGCDSVVFLHLHIPSAFRDTQQISICAGEQYSFHGISYSIPGAYTARYHSISSGCDSLYVLQLQVNPIPPPPSVQNPVTLCGGQTTTPLRANGSNLLWYTNISTGTGAVNAPVPNTTQTGQIFHYVSQTVNGCESPRATIEVNVKEKPVAGFEIAPDTLCTGTQASVTLTGQAPPTSTLLWGWDHAQVTGSSPGPYTVRWTDPGIKTVWLVIDNEGCTSDTAYKSITIQTHPANLEIIMPPHACIMQPVELAAKSTGQTATTYSWVIDGIPYPDTSHLLLTWQTPGYKNITLNAISGICPAPKISGQIQIMPLPKAEIISDDVVICLNDTLHLQAAPVNRATYDWTPELYFKQYTSMGQYVTAVIRKAGIIHLSVTDAYGCNATDSVPITTMHCCEAWLPDAFTPNGDGRNDRFRLISPTVQHINAFMIYNRWGEQVFSAHGTSAGWDGTWKGQPSEVGTYHYYIRYTCSDGSEYTQKGSLTLIR